MQDDDNRIFRTFEEFEREELRRMECLGGSVHEMIETLFGAVLDLGLCDEGDGDPTP